MFADDTNLFLSDKNINNLLSNMNIELAKVTTWFKANKLSLNVKKTKWSLFHSASKKRFIPEILPKLFMDDNEIQRQTVTKFLGVLIDENLSWKNQIENVSNKISKSIGILYRTRVIISKKNLKQLYFAFIHSYINYACIAWASTNKTKLACLYRHQKHAMRVINFKDRFTHAAPLFLDIKALSIYKLNIYNILCLVFKSMNKLCPTSFYNLVKIKPPNKYNLRNERTLSVPFCKTKFNQFGINCRSPYLWNNIIRNNFIDTTDSST
jgi:hypothetical protein